LFSRSTTSQFHRYLSANISIASSSNNSGVSLNLVGGGCEDNAVLYTTRRDYLKPADVFVFAIFDKPDTTKMSTMSLIKPKAGELYVINVAVHVHIKLIS
jgi:hypothetical protein